MSVAICGISASPGCRFHLRSLSYGGQVALSRLRLRLFSKSYFFARQDVDSEARSVVGAVIARKMKVSVLVVSNLICACGGAERIGARTGFAHALMQVACRAFPNTIARTGL